MLVRGKVVGERGVARFEAVKDGKGVAVRAEFPEGEPLEYSVECPCLEPLELVGLLLPAFEERLGKIEGVFVEEVVEEGTQSLLGKLKRMFSRG
ncbi:hypothetical protein [Thermococcus sp. JdF3]|uniref:hypothetical protein n=1 Tax=Thermococcus sp. JdF3 TaxID=1638258 RepID=UPI00143958EE|nr:hypothetical protein [Thermococcus sp. JdF3]NJE01456.1 hypothetical protein [Thermococcus sp. JdF3]